MQPGKEILEKYKELVISHALHGHVGLLPADGCELRAAVGIGTMHYTGMEAMRMDGAMMYQPALFALSIIVADLLAGVADLKRFSALRGEAAYEGAIGRA